MVKTVLLPAISPRLARRRAEEWWEGSRWVPRAASPALPPPSREPRPVPFPSSAVLTCPGSDARHPARFCFPLTCPLPGGGALRSQSPAASARAVAAGPRRPGCPAAERTGGAGPRARARRTCWWSPRRQDRRGVPQRGPVLRGPQVRAVAAPRGRLRGAAGAADGAGEVPFAARRLFTPTRGRPVSELDALQAAGKYVAAGRERFRKLE